MGTAKQEWGEESSSDAVYTVFLRKVRYVPPNNYKGRVPAMRAFDADLGPDAEMSHLQWETVKERVIKAGTLDKLVDNLLLPDGELNNGHFNVFFNTYRPFASAFDVLRRVLARYSDVATGSKETAKLPSRRRALMLNSLRSVITCWLDLFPEDFCERADFLCLGQIIEFSRQHPVHLNELSNKALRLRERFSKEINGYYPHDNPSTVLELLDQNSNLPPTVEYLDYLLSPIKHRPSDVLLVDALAVAEQLTYWDAQLFHKMRAYQCQGYFWSRRRDKRKTEHVQTVRATVEQFNAVTKRVMASIVHPECRHSHRAKVLAKWIQVAKHLRQLKNFSSLKAVLSALQSQPVHRLSITWNAVAADFSELNTEFSDLSAIFNPHDEDGLTAKQLLEQEGTAKSTTSPAKMYGKNHRKTKSDVGESAPVGTVPYLGSFLSELTYIDELPDKTETGLINFDKRRKEFDVLARIKLFQAAASQYAVERDDSFVQWFRTLPQLSEKDCYTRSVEIQPTTSPARSHMRKTNTLSRILGLSLLDGDNVGAEDSWFSVSDNHHLSRSTTEPTHIGQSVFYHSSEFDPKRAFVYSAHPQPYALYPHQPPSRPGSAMASCSNRSSYDDSVSSLDTPPPPDRVSAGTKSSSYPEAKLIRVGPEDDLADRTTGAPNYVSVRLDSNDRVQTVIEKALRKLHTLTGQAQDYRLVQVLPDETEFVLPEGCNPFYASKPESSHVLNFLLRSKGGQRAPVKKKNRVFLNRMKRWNSGLL